MKKPDEELLEEIYKDLRKEKVYESMKMTIEDIGDSYFLTNPTNIIEYILKKLPKNKKFMEFMAEKMELDEEEVYKVLTNVAFKWKEDSMKFRKQSENICLDHTSALLKTKGLIKVKE